MDAEVSLTRVADTRMEALENGQLCLELRRSGMSMAKIADHLGLQVTNVRRLLARALKDVQAVDVAEVRALEASRLDFALEKIWPDVEQGDLRAIDRMLRISHERRALYGADQLPQGARDEEFNGPAILEVVPWRPAEAAEPADGVVPTPAEGVEQQEKDH